MPDALPDAPQLKTALNSALDTPAAAPRDADMAAEDLLLIATGRGDELSAARRDQLLEAVASDPGVAALLQDAHALAALQSSAGQGGTQATDAPSAVAPPPPTFQFPRAAIKTVFALAACLTVALGLWRFADPPSTQVAANDPVGLFDQPGLIVPSGVDSAPPETETTATARSPRDTALIVTGGLAVVLGLGLVLLTRGREANQAA